MPSERFSANAVVRGCVAVCLVCSACGSALPEPVAVHPPASSYSEVPFPPPPGRVEMVPAQPRSDAMWVDGTWVFRGERWVWSPGGWVVPARGARFSSWDVVYLPDGRILFTSSQWWNRAGRKMDAPPFL